MDTFFLFVTENFVAFSLLLLCIFILIVYEGRKGGRRIDTNEVTRLINKEEAIVIDIRSSNEFSSGHITNAINIQPNKIDQQIDAIKAPKESPIILVCKTGNNSRVVGSKLQKNGFQNINIISGGMLSWLNQGLPVSK